MFAKAPNAVTVNPIPTTTGALTVAPASNPIVPTNVSTLPVTAMTSPVDTVLPFFKSDIIFAVVIVAAIGAVINAVT